MFAIGVFFCACGWIFQPIAIVFANKAIAKGNPNASIARTLSIVFLVLSVIGVIGYIAMVSMAINSGMVPKQQFQPQVQ
jgi:hypothetical protein